MLTISARSMAAFREYATKGYIDRMCRHVRAVYPEFYYNRMETEIRCFIERAISRAQLYELYDEYAVTRFLDYSILLGTEFECLDENDWILRILDDEERKDLEKIAAIDRSKFNYTGES